MRRRRARTSYLLAIVGVCAFGGVARPEVLDLSNGEYSTAQKKLTRSVSVIDFGTQAANRLAPGTAVIDLNRRQEIKPEPQASPPADIILPRDVQGPLEIERLIQITGLKYIEDPRIEAAHLTKPEWLKFFRANIEVESGFNPEAISTAGAIGLGQLLPETAAKLGVDPQIPAENLDGSARYLLTQLGTFGSKELALAAYNAGPLAVVKYGGIPPYDETKGHVRKVMALLAPSQNKEPST